MEVKEGKNTDITALFQQLHRLPEMAFQERETTALIRKALTDQGIEVTPGGTETGLIAILHGTGEGPTIGLRADIDALPIQEDSGLPYASEQPGVMHACGHDFHAAAMVGVALRLQEKRREWPGTIKIAFQPGEETDTGAPPFLACGKLDDCQLFLSLHTYPQEKAGWLGIKEGAVMASVDRFQVTLTGRGAHAAQPDKGTDPIVMQAEIISALQTLVSRTVSPFSQSVVSVTHVQGGNTWNIIPETVYFQGTVRTLSKQDRETLRTAFERMVTGMARAMGGTADIEWTAGSPPVINDPALCVLARQVAEQCGFRYGQQEGTMGGEDFAYYLENRPGLFVRIGTGGDYPAHHPRFTADPKALEGAVDFLSQLAIACVSREQ